MATKMVRICPSCDKENESSAVTCSNCSCSLSNVTPQKSEHSSCSPRPQPGPEVTPKCECGAELRPGDKRCVYCDRPVPGGQDACAGTGFTLCWPWGEATSIQGRIFIGRVPPADDDLARRLERDYPNVSRMHAEICIGEGGLLVRDLHSLNGTYLNGTRLEPGEFTNAVPGDSLRFASGLETKITTICKEAEA